MKMRRRIEMRIQPLTGSTYQQNRTENGDATATAQQQAEAKEAKDKGKTRTKSGLLNTVPRCTLGGESRRLCRNRSTKKKGLANQAAARNWDASLVANRWFGLVVLKSQACGRYDVFQKQRKTITSRVSESKEKLQSGLRKRTNVHVMSAQPTATGFEESMTVRCILRGLPHKVWAHMSSETVKQNGSWDFRGPPYSSTTSRTLAAAAAAIVGGFSNLRTITIGNLWDGAGRDMQHEVYRGM
ncbi:hypothetical protein FN846DRAFT_678635 [Sphaerosporella brunnea]|uniref:Uncharacterized protein n=1 Tax=Sphaerosporella brunnea TaxID=1250544 RepID=A0A5J5FAY1_9PEZI|nr:hypothetical protein FN846DRAFT_678635 [Sphaerosporella brunnea]